ncbi:hypothetical protein CcCBS67573_g08559 [Chytriomyces confervae]|uniref:Uncharacterized protein n=1 Tax=Chytriomyces confervae TaxID=246404 RepID=A0A507EJ64_9FUNG|nr:hypothetical protein CcCBS67573_g08559 [Chytriomyces confervae]
MRLIPIAVDLIILATFFASVLRVGRLELRLEKIDNFVIRWTLLQLIFLGNAVLDTCIGMAAQSQFFVSVARREDEHMKPSNISTNLASSAMSGLASALGLGSGPKDQAGGGEERRWRAESPGLRPYDTAPTGLQKKRSSSQMRETLTRILDR